MANGPGLLFPLGLNLDTAAGSLGPGLTLALALNLDTPAISAADVYVSWDIPTNNTDGTVLTNLLGFEVWYGQTSGVYDFLYTVADPTATFALLEALEPGTWYFNVRAYTATEESAFAGEIAAVLSSPDTVFESFDAAYSIVSGVFRDLQGTYTVNLSATVENELDSVYDIQDSVEVDLVASWFVSTIPTYAWFARLTGGFATWASLGGEPGLVVQGDLAATYSVAGPVSNDFVVLYALAEAGIIEGGGLIPLSVANELGSIYEVLNAPQLDFVAQYSMVVLVERDLFGQYNVDAGIPPVEADFSAIWSFGEPVENDFAALFDISNTVQEDLSPTFTVLNAAEEDLEALFNVGSELFRDFSADWTNFNQPPPDPVDTFLTAAWELFNAPDADLAASWSIHGASVERDRVAVYNVLNDVERDFAPEWQMVELAEEDLAALYDLEAPAGTAESNLLFAWNVLETREQDFDSRWSLGGEVLRDLVSDYNIRITWNRPPRPPKNWTPVVTDDIWTPVTPPDDSWSE